MDTMKDNKIVYIDLSEKRTVQKEILPDLRKEYVGGCGINTKLLYDSEAMYNDALSEKNLLIFGVGCTIGTGLVASNRLTITAKSPITGLYGDSNAGGDFPYKMRAVGIDHLVFSGKADKPVYVYINKDAEVQILDASDLWSTWTDKATDILLERHGSKCGVACIGPAGANLVRFASVIISKDHAAGKTGMGCVMGSKNLKAVVIESTKFNVPMYDSEKIQKVKTSWFNNCKKSLFTKLGRLEGSMMLIKRYEAAKCIPIRNCQSASDEKIKNIYPEKFTYEYQTKNKACLHCPVGCAREYEITHGKYKGEKGDRIDYGAIAGVGPSTGIFDWPSILHLKMLTDYLGFDAIEIGGAIGLVMECQERGILTEKDTGGRVFKFGNEDDVEELMHMIANRKGIGDIIAEGTYLAGKRLNAEEYALCTNRSSVGMHANSHLAKSLSYITSSRGGDHLKAYVFTAAFGGFFSEVVSKHIFKSEAEKEFANPEKKGRVVWWHENYKYIVDSLGICFFVMMGLPNTGVGYFNDFAEIMNGLFNLDMTDEDVLRAGERTYQLQNSFNVNCGLSMDDYQWPTRKKESGVDDELIKTSTITVRDHPGMLPEYFRYRGLTKDGKPTVTRFLELGLDNYIEKGMAVDKEEAVSIKALLNEVALNAKLSRGEKIKSKIINTLLFNLLGKKDESGRKKYLKEKKALAIKQEGSSAS